ncbi:MAG: hypothetical protein ACT4QD_00840 [Acidobacteriota bacterium]
MSRTAGLLLSLSLALAPASATIPTPDPLSQLAGTSPDRIIVAKAGEGAVIPEGPPMALSGVGDAIRRSVLLVVHDSSQPWMTVTSDWSPQGRCPR